jgi:phosphoglycerate kinase
MSDGMFQGVARLEHLRLSPGQSVLVRADLNVPLLEHRDGTREVADDFRIRAALPTLQWLVDRGVVVTVASHLGRPKGHPDPDLSMEPVRNRLSEFIDGVEVLENLRFSPGEEANDPRFGSELVKGRDAYVNDAFGVCHRAHASVMYPPSVLPSAAGLLLRSELDALDRVIQGRRHPFTLVVGGAKVHDKIGTIRTLACQADRLLVGGAMANTFLAARGIEVGDSPVDEDELGECRKLMDSHEVELPFDILAGQTDNDASRAPEGPRGALRSFEAEIPRGWRGLDIGPRTRRRYAERISGSATVLWNGPMGVFEDPRCEAGTREVASAIAGCPGFTVAGGGDTLAAVRKWGLEDDFSHLSTGGGAMLALIEQNGKLPGLEALRWGRVPASGCLSVGPARP